MNADVSSPEPQSSQPRSNLNGPVSSALQRVNQLSANMAESSVIQSSTSNSGGKGVLSDEERCVSVQPTDGRWQRRHVRTATCFGPVSDAVSDASLSAFVVALQGQFMSLWRPIMCRSQMYRSHDLSSSSSTAAYLSSLVQQQQETSASNVSANQHGASVNNNNNKIKNDPSANSKSRSARTESRGCEAAYF